MLRTLIRFYRDYNLDITDETFNVLVSHNQIDETMEALVKDDGMKAHLVFELSTNLAEVIA